MPEDCDDGNPYDPDSPQVMPPTPKQWQMLQIVIMPFSPSHSKCRCCAKSSNKIKLLPIKPLPIKPRIKPRIKHNTKAKVVEAVVEEVVDVQVEMVVAVQLVVDTNKLLNNCPLFPAISSVLRITTTVGHMVVMLMTIILV